MLYFITIKILNKRQAEWFKKLKKYKFKIYYILKKNNTKTNTLNKRLDLINDEFLKILILRIIKNDIFELNI